MTRWQKNSLLAVFPPIKPINKTEEELNKINFTLKDPDWSKRFTHLIKWNNELKDWDYEERSTNLLLIKSDSNDHSKRAKMYGIAVTYRNIVHFLVNEVNYDKPNVIPIPFIPQLDTYVELSKQIKKTNEKQNEYFYSYFEDLAKKFQEAYNWIKEYEKIKF